MFVFELTIQKCAVVLLGNFAGTIAGMYICSCRSFILVIPFLNRVNSAMSLLLASASAERLVFKHRIAQTTCVVVL